MSNSGKNGVVTLGGREFKRVKNGVDEAEIGAFVDELIHERDELARSQHHIASLTKLAETTIVEADKMANQIKAEALEKAQSESAAILDRANDEAQEIAKKKEAEVLESASEKAKAILSEAQMEASQLIENDRARAREELGSIIDQQFAHLLDKLENLKQEAAAAQADFRNRLPDSTKETPVVATAMDVESRAASHETLEESRAAPQETPEESEAVPEEIHQETAAPSSELEKEGNAVMEEGKAFDEKPVATEAEEQQEEGFDISGLLQMEDWTQSTEPQFEVEILPPINMSKIMELVAYLDQLPEVQNTEIIPRMESPSILVFLRGELNLVEVLQTISAVAHVEEVAAEADAGNGESGKVPTRIRVGLSGNGVRQETG